MPDFLESQQEQIIQCYKQMDDIFHAYAVANGLSDSTFWILYTLCQSEKPYTQNDFCEEWYYSKQTVHSAVAILVKAGYVRLEHVPGSRNSKCIVLTEAGKRYGALHIQPILEAERRAFAGLTQEERQLYFQLVKKHLALFGQAVEELHTHKQSSEDSPSQWPSR